MTRESKLNDGVLADGAFEHKALTYCDNTNPFLREPREGDELGEFIIDMMPPSLNAHKLIVKSAVSRATDGGNGPSESGSRKHSRASPPKTCPPSFLQKGH